MAKTAHIDARWEKSRMILADHGVIDRINQAGDFLAFFKKTDLREAVIHYATTQAPLESHIEVFFFAWWQAFRMLTEDEFVQLPLFPQQDVIVGDESFRLDFTVSLRGINTFPRIAVELDGHDFHERTKEQVAHRNHRDRLLQQHGWKVFHVSGSELFRDAVNVVGDIYQHCWNEGLATIARARARA